MRRRFQVRVNRNPQMTLNITSMTDMFTILLVFLLQNYSASQIDIDPVSGVRLPSSISEKNPVDGVRIGLSQTELVIGKEKVLALEGKRFRAADIDSHDTNFLPALFKQLQEVNTKNPEKAKEGKILFQADRDIDYDTLRKVMYTSSMAGFPNIKLVTQLGSN